MTVFSVGRNSPVVQILDHDHWQVEHPRIARRSGLNARQRIKRILTRRRTRSNVR